LESDAFRDRTSSFTYCSGANCLTFVVLEDR
jgi:hypothetical protein